MNKFLSLMKVTLIDQFNLNKLFKREKIIGKVLMGLLFLGAYILFGFYFGYMLYGFGLMGSQLGDDYSFILDLGFLIVGFILVMTTLTKANAYLFKAKDFELLSSLTIPLSTIVISKISSFLLFTYLSIGIVYIPLMIVYSMFVSVNFIYWLTAVIGFFLIPLLIVSILSVLSFLISLLLSRFKYRNALTTIFSLIMFFGVMIFTFSFSSDFTETLSPSLAETLSNLTKYIYFPNYLLKEVLLGNHINIIYLVLISIIPFILFVYYTGKVYVYVNSQLSRNFTSTKFNDKLVATKSTKGFISLIKLELKKFFSIPLYVINALVGPLMTVIMVGVFLFNKEISGELLIHTELAVLLILGISFFMMGMTGTTTSTISLEGKNMWILKSLPIKETEIFWSKLLVDIIFKVGSSIILSILVLISLKLNIFIFVLLMLVLCIYSIISSIFGLLVNLKFNKLDWDLPVKVIKQGLPVFLNMLFGLLFSIVMAILIYVFMIALSLDVLITLSIILFILILVLILEVIILNKIGVKLFNEIKA